MFWKIKFLTLQKFNLIYVHRIYIVLEYYELNNYKLQTVPVTLTVICYVKLLPR